jgi:hypothetical protein
MKAAEHVGLTRRDWLKGMATAGMGAALAGCAHTQTHLESPLGFLETDKGNPSSIWAENLKPGTTDWMLSKTTIDPGAKYRCPWIEGFCSRTSIGAGQRLTLFVSTNPESNFTIEIYRLGYYDGTGGRLMTKLGPFPGQTQPDPPVGKQRLRQCRWKASAEFSIPHNWLSGVYVGKLTAESSGLQSYIIFIVRDTRRADFVFQCSDITWQAYNRWPNQFALYDNGQEHWWCGPNVEVSFDRPYGKYCQILDAPLSTGSGEWFLWEFPFAYWVESKGYDVTYISNLDTHASPATLKRAKGFLSVGHDEYYSLRMYHHLRNAIAAGLNVAFFSGNTCCGRIDLRGGVTESQRRRFSRVDYYGPRDEGMMKRFPSMSLFPHKSPREDLLLGARSNVPPCTGGADWICSLPEHWIYHGTGMKNGEAIPGLIGWEFHGEPAAIPGLQVVATGPTQSAPDEPNGGTYTATIYEGLKRNFVFNASTCWWGDGLSQPPGYVRPSVYTSPRGPDARVQRITTNVLERMRRFPALDQTT